MLAQGGLLRSTLRVAFFDLMAGRAAAVRIGLAPGLAEDPAEFGSVDKEGGRGLRRHLLTQYKLGHMTAKDVCVLLHGTPRKLAQKESAILPTIQTALTRQSTS